jgi:Tol biopolymer transport system component
MVAMTAIGNTLGYDRLLIGDPQTGERHGIFRISEVDDHAFFASIAFSPTGDRVLFCAPDIGSPTNAAYLLSVTVDGDDPILVSDRPSCLADWSSTDRIVAAAGDRLDRIVTMDPDGTDRRLVVPPAPRPTSWGVGGSPSWSPDGSRFVYSFRVGPTRRFDLFSVAADGSDRVRLTHTPHHDELYPVVSPDGTAVAFTRSIRFRRFPSDLFMMAEDGSGVVRLTDTPLADEYADSWGVQI